MQITKKIGKKLADQILKLSPKKKAFLIALEGDLGGGKTTFLQGLAKGLGIKERILSPTFLILKKFKIEKPKSQKTKFKYFYHLDCYRIQNPKELLDLGFKKIIDDPQNIVALEWAEKVKKILPLNTFWLKFQFKSKTQRKITIQVFPIKPGSFLCFI